MLLTIDIRSALIVTLTCLDNSTVMSFNIFLCYQAELGDMLITAAGNNKLDDIKTLLKGGIHINYHDKVSIKFVID